MQYELGLVQNRKLIIISLIIGAFIIFVISVVIGLNDILNTLENANPNLILLALILQFIIFAAWTVRWSLILKVVDKSPGFKKLFVMMFTSFFGNNITPGAAGGEPLRAYLLKKLEGTPFEIGFASASVDRVFEFFPFLLVSLIAIYLIAIWNVTFWTKFIVITLITLTMIFSSFLIYAGIKKELAIKLIISLIRPIFPFFIRITKKEISFSYVKDRLIYYVDRFSSGFLQALADRKMFVFGLLISFGMWVLDVAKVYVCFVAIGSYPPIFPLAIIYTVGILVTILPTLPGALGIREIIMVALFAVVGVPADVVIAASLIERLVSYVIPTFIGAFTAIYYGNKLKENGSRVL